LGRSSGRPPRVWPVHCKGWATHRCRIASAAPRGLRYHAPIRQDRPRSRPRDAMPGVREGGSSMSRAALMLGAATLLLPALAAGQLVPPLAGAPASFDFAFANPGARSLGFGGAFVALADDATAAF